MNLLDQAIGAFEKKIESGTTLKDFCDEFPLAKLSFQEIFVAAEIRKSIHQSTEEVGDAETV